MATIVHEYPKGWRVVEVRVTHDEKGNETRKNVPLSCLGFTGVEEALAYFAAARPEVEIDLRCDCCGRKKPVSPEPVCSTFLLTCKACQAVPGAVSPPSDAELGKPMKKPRPGLKETRADWLARTAGEVRKFNMTTTGVTSLDRAMRLACAPRKQARVDVSVAREEVSETCQLCGDPLGDEHVDGVVKGAGWAYMCVPCHGRHGIGLGTGRGQLYRIDPADGRYHLVHQGENEPAGQGVDA